MVVDTADSSDVLGVIDFLNSSICQSAFCKIPAAVLQPYAKAQNFTVRFDTTRLSIEGYPL
jgi:hypothetical protein